MPLCRHRDCSPSGSVANDHRGHAVQACRSTAFIGFGSAMMKWAQYAKRLTETHRHRFCSQRPVRRRDETATLRCMILLTRMGNALELPILASSTGAYPGDVPQAVTLQGQMMFYTEG